MVLGGRNKTSSFLRGRGEGREFNQHPRCFLIERSHGNPIGRCIHWRESPGVLTLHHPIGEESSAPSTNAKAYPSSTQCIGHVPPPLGESVRSPGTQAVHACVAGDTNTLKGQDVLDDAPSVPLRSEESSVVNLHTVKENLVEMMGPDH
jgi:hypothetical protein